jgi:hypothetical protein
MVDNLTPERRSALMAAVRGKARNRRLPKNFDAEINSAVAFI